MDTRRKKRGLIGDKTSLSLIAGALMGGSVAAQEENFDWDSKFAKRLMTYKTEDLKDIAILQLEKMLTQYPEQKDMVNLLIAEVYHLQNQNKSFDEAIVKIGKNSPLYAKSLQLKAQRAIKRGKADDAIANYVEYFNLFPTPPEEESAKEDWKLTVNLYSTVLSASGQTSKAQEVKGWLAQAADSKFELRKIAFESSRIELQSIEASASTDDATIRFDGKASSFKIPNITMPAKYTIEMLIKPAKNTPAAFFAARPVGKPKEHHIAMLMLGTAGSKNRKIEVHHSANSKKTDHKITGGAVNDGELHHIAVTFNGKALRLYRDGKEIAVKPDRIASIANKPMDLFLGCDGQKSFFNGEIDNFRIWNRALTAKQIQDKKFDAVSAGEGLLLSYDFNDKAGVAPIAGTAKAEPKKVTWGSKNTRSMKLKFIVGLLKDNTYQNDYISAASQVEMARCYWLLNDYKSAVTIIRQGAELMLNLEKSMVKAKQDINLSPLAGAFFYYGMCYKAIADDAKSAGSQAKAEKAYKGALDKLASIIEKYPTSSYTPRCRIALSEIKEKVTAMGWGDEQLAPYEKAFAANLSSGTEEGNAFYFAGEYEKAIESYRKALTASLRGAKIKEALKFLTLSLIKNPNKQISSDGRCWEAEAVADYLISAYPTADEAIDVCLRMGGMYGGEQKNASGDLKAKLTDSALRWYGEFINMRPKDEQAPNLKFKIAENSRVKSLQIAQAIQKETDTLKIQELIDELNRELYRLIPQYVDLAENYPESPNAVKSLKILGLIYSQLNEYEKAAEAYIQYVKKQTDPKENLLTFSLIAAEQYRKGHKAEKAVAQYQATIDMAEKSGKNDAETKALIEKCYSLMATANDIIGDEAERKIADISKTVYDINAKSREAGRTIRANKKAIEKLAETQKEANQEFAAIIEALEQSASTDVDIKLNKNATDAEKKAAAKQKAEASKRLKQQLMVKLAGEISGEKLELENGFDAASALLERNSDESNKNSVLKSKAKLAISDAEKLIKLSDLRLKSLEKDKAKALKQREVTKADLDKVVKELEQVRELMLSPDRKEKEEAEIRQFELLDQLRTVRLADKAAAETVQNVLLSEQVDKVKYETDKATAKATLIEQSEVLKNAERSEKRFALRDTVYTAKVDAYKAGLAKNKVQKKMLEKKDFDSFKKEVERASKAYKELLTTANTKENQLFALDKAFLEEDNSNLQQFIEKSKVSVADLEKSKAPHQQVFKKYKTEAVKYYDQFLSIYKKSKEFGAKNLARAGKIYIDFEQFDKAAVYLTRLERDFPKSEEIKRAKFDLANAYVKTGRYGKAVASFNQALKSTKDYSPNKMAKVQRELLEVYEREGEEAAKLLPVSAKAGKAFYAKIKAKKSDKLLQSQHDLCLFRIGEAYFFAKDYKNALKYYDLLLSANEKTGFLFQVKYHQGITYRNMQPADLDASIAAFNEVTRFGDKAGQLMTYQAMVESAVTSAAKQNYAGLQNAISTLDLVVSGFNSENQELIPVFERAYNMLVKYLAQNGREKEALKYADDYIKNFPEGKYTAVIKRLPGQKYSAPVKSTIEKK